MVSVRTSNAGVAFARRVYGPRALGCVLSFLFVAVTIYPGSWVLWLPMLLNGFVWPLLAYQVAVRASSAYRAELFNLRLDCLFAGCWVVVMQFSLLPSVLLISMVTMNSVAAKGLGFMLQGLLLNLLGGLLVGAALGFEIETQMPGRVIWACIPALMLYPLIVGLACYRLAQQLFAQQKALSIVSSSDGSSLIDLDRWLYDLAQVFHRCRCGTAQASLAYIRIDDFDVLRQRHGNLVAKALSIRLGHLIQHRVRGTDLLSRQVSGEFWVLFPQARRFAAQALIERIEEGFRQLSSEVDTVPDVRIRLGLVEFSAHLESEHEWQELARAHSFLTDATQPSSGDLDTPRLEAVERRVSSC